MESADSAYQRKDEFVKQPETVMLVNRNTCSKRWDATCLDTGPKFFLPNEEQWSVDETLCCILLRSDMPTLTTVCCQIPYREPWQKRLESHPKTTRQ